MPLDTTGLCRNYDEDLKTIKGNHNNKGKKFKDAQTLPKLTLFLLSSGRIRQYSVTVAGRIYYLTNVKFTVVHSRMI